MCGSSIRAPRRSTKTTYCPSTAWIIFGPCRRPRRASGAGWRSGSSGCGRGSRCSCSWCHLRAQNSSTPSAFDGSPWRGTLPATSSASPRSRSRSRRWQRPDSVASWTRCIPRSRRATCATRPRSCASAAWRCAGRVSCSSSPGKATCSRSISTRCPPARRRRSVGSREGFPSRWGSPSPMGASSSPKRTRSPS